MADPFSIAASIAGILSLADTVVTRLIKYAKSVKGAEDEAKAWASEVNDFGGTIDRLARLTRALEAQGEAFDHTMRMHHIEGCHRVLSNVDDLLKKAERGLESQSQLTALHRKLKWPLSSGPRIKELMSTLSEHKARIAMALSADSMNGILQCLALSTSILDEIRDTKRITARIEESLETERVLSFFLKPEVNPQERYETSLRLRHPRTGLWLLRHPDFLTWIDTPGSKLWLTGIPGAGKTVLAGSVVEEALARRSDNVAVAFFFCDYKDEKTHLPVNILGALAYQLAIQSDEAYAILSRYYDELHPPRQMAQNPTIGGLQNTLSEMLGQYDRTYLMVDGLDECGEHVDDVVEAITSWAEDEERLNIALLSRDQTNIRSYLKDGYPILETAAQTEDVEQYVRAQIEERIRTRRLRLHDPLLKDEIVQGLTEGAKGMFRWVACQLDHLGTCLTDQECRDALTMLPPTLFETYTRILKRIPHKQVAIAHMVLNFIAFAHPPLPIPLLEHAISVSPKRGTLRSGDVIREATISELCSSLVRIKSLETYEWFEFAHFSVREFLDSEELVKLGLEDFRVSKPTCDRLLAVQCLRYLQLNNFSESPDATIEGILSVTQEHKSYLFYYYASFFWVMHARDEWTTLADRTVVNLAAKLFDPRKTPAFTRWAATLTLAIVLRARSGFPFTKIVSLMTQKVRIRQAMEQFSSGPIGSILTPVSRIFDRNFRPLHLAAILRLSEICKLHLHVHGPASVANMQSPLGTPVQCAVAGVRLLSGCTRAFWEPDTANYLVLWEDLWFQYFYQPRLDERESPEPQARKIECLLAPGAERLHSSLPGNNNSLMGFAIINAYDSIDFSVVSLLLERGILPTDNELAWFESGLTKLALEKNGIPAPTARIDRALRSFIMTLNDLLGKLPGVLPLACMVWKIAVRSNSSISEHTSVLDTRIWLADDALLEWAIGTIESANLKALDLLLHDPRLDQMRVRRTVDGGSLLHALALRLDVQDGLVRTQEDIDMATRLLEAGFSPSVVNDKGETPLHVWGWEWELGIGNESGCGLLKDLVRAFVQAGLDVEMKDQRGSNVLHANAGRPRQLRAVLETVDRETVSRALRATTHQGYTPLMEALRMGQEASANAMLQFWAEGHGWNDAGRKAMDIAQVVAELSSSEGTQLVQRLLDSGMCVGLDQQCHPLHQLGLKPSLGCVKLLKALYPHSCGTRAEGRLPLDNYLRQQLTHCLEAVPSFSEVLSELATFDFRANDDQQANVGVWSYFTESLKKGRESGRVNPHELRHLARPAVLCLVDLGYLEAYEAGTGESGLIQMLAALQPAQWKSMDDLSPVSAESIVPVVKHTTCWSVFASSRIAAQLLEAAFNSGKTQLIRSMLERGMDLYRTHGSRSFLGVVCGCHIEMDDDKRQTLFRMLLDHAGSSQLNDLSPVGQTGLIHQAAAGNSAWVVEELIRRGADPNLRTGPTSESRPALIFHLDLGKLNSARALLYHGADPTKQDAWGRDAALAAVESSQGSSSFLEELAIAETCKFSWQINWQQTCTLPGKNRTHTRSGLNALHLGAFRNVGSLRFYLDRQLLEEIDCIDSGGYTPLLHAAIAGQVQQVDYLCQKGANVDFQLRTSGETALHFAVLGQSFSVVQALLQHGAQFLPDGKGRKPLILAYTTGNQGIIRALQQADTGFMLRHAPRATPSPMQETSSEQSPPGLAHALQAGIVSGNLEFCQQLHASGCHLDVDLECGGCSPLILATRCEEFDIVKWLLESGASSTKVSCTLHGDALLYKTPLELLLSQSTKVGTELIQLFIDKFRGEGGDIFQGHLVFLAAESNNTTALGLLLEQREWLATRPSREDVYSDHTFLRQTSPLRAAVEGGHFEAAELLLKHGVQVGNNSKFGNLDEALQIAVDSRVPRQAELVRLLLDYGANVNFRCFTQYLDTPILLASGEGNQELVNCLVEAGADWTAVNLRGSSVLHCAVYGQNPEIFADFGRKGASIHLEDRDGITALHEAMDHGFFAAWVLNGDLDMELASPFPWGLIVETHLAWITTHFRLYRKRFGQALLQRVGNMEPADRCGWSPLCMMAAEGNTTGMENLVELGARLDHEGSPQGSALMAACANRELESAKFLVRNGASLSYISSRQNTQGHTMSCLTAAQGSASIINWLLVGRFTERHRITQPPDDLADLGHGRSDTVKHWAGITKAELVITGVYERQPTESSSEYFVRLQHIRREMRGRLVPPMSSGRRTCRPSRLVPEETVHISPDDKRVPK